MDAFETTVDEPIEEAELAVRQALLEEGFGVLTEIDVAATLEAKLGVQRAPLKILGACNPSFAHRALEVDRSLALLLPCNVVLEESPTGRTLVSIADPRTMLALGDPRTAEGSSALGEEAAAALRRAIDRLQH